MTQGKTKVVLQEDPSVWPRRGRGEVEMLKAVLRRLRGTSEAATGVIRAAFPASPVSGS